MKSKISIVIPTYKRKEYVVNLLQSLSGKVGKDTQIIIVEQVEKNERAYLGEAKKLHLILKYCFLPHPSMTCARNMGVHNATGEYILFLDDDCLLKTEITSYIKDFEDEKIAAIVGKIITRGQKIKPIKNKLGRISVFGKFSDTYLSNTREEVDTVIGCNMCWRKNVLLELGGFDEQFTGNALREESDLSLRAKRKGYKILFDPRVEVEHVRAESGGARKTEGRIQWYFDFFSNETYFFLKHWPFWAVPIIMLTRWEWALRCMLGFGREVSSRSFTTPLKGFLDGYKKFWRYKNENRG